MLTVINTLAGLDARDAAEVRRYWSADALRTLYVEPKKLGVSNVTLYLVLGCGTTTIYSIEMDGKEASVLCVESLDGFMETLFYMYARTEFPPRCGYVYGYLVVKRCLERHRVAIKDILDICWREVLRDHL